MSGLSIDDCGLIFQAARQIPDDLRDAFFKDCADMLRGRRCVTASDVYAAIAEAHRARERRTA